MVAMDPAHTTKRTVPPTELGAPVTGVEQVYVIGHFGIAQVPERDWSLRVDGLVARPLRLSLEQLRALPSVTATAVLECFGNPLEPDVPVRRAANVRWRGVAVSTLLEAAGASGDATMLWAAGLDSGRFGGVACSEYLKDLPLDVPRERGMIAYEMNGEPLTAEHGHPARLFVPGYFGTNNVKWLRSLTVADRRREHLFTTRLYQRPSPGGGAPEPVREMDVNSMLSTAPALPVGPVTLTGWAWGAAPVTQVRVRIDATWLAAELEPRPAGAFGWQRFTLRHDFAAGEHRVTVRASDARGRVQPLEQARNQAHEVTLQVRG